MAASVSLTRTQAKISLAAVLLCFVDVVNGYHLACTQFSK